MTRLETAELESILNSSSQQHMYAHPSTVDILKQMPKLDNLTQRHAFCSTFPSPDRPAQ